MGSPGDISECQWVERVKLEGPVPLLDPDNCPNGWASPSGENFMVRGPDYLTTRVKIPAGEYLLRPLGFDWIKSSAKIGEVLKNPSCRVRKVIDDEFRSGYKPFIWAFNLQVPSKDNYSAVAYFVATEPIPEGSLMDQFLKGDDGFRNSRLKLIANIVNGPWIVRKAVGEQAVCIIGRALSCKYCVEENFLEVDVDIGSSMVASAIVHLAFGYITMLTVDLGFVLEGQTESELPERLLGAFRFSNLNPASACSLEPSPYESADGLQSSLPTRLWKSIGQGFSQLLHPGAQESGSTSGSAHVNGTSIHEAGGQWGRFITSFGDFSFLLELIQKIPSPDAGQIMPYNVLLDLPLLSIINYILCFLALIVLKLLMDVIGSNQYESNALYGHAPVLPFK